MKKDVLAVLAGLFLLSELGHGQQGSALDDKLLEQGDKLLDEAKASYEIGRDSNSTPSFIEAGFKLEEARIKFIVLQEIGSPDKQKTASDRMRAVNQLSKLIHDGKVAISGAPAGSAELPLPKQPESAPGAEPPKTPPTPLTVLKPVDVTKRSAIPEQSKQRDAEKNIKDLFKEQYAKKSPADRKILGRLLLENAAKSQDDPVAQWVLYREAQDAAIQICDVQGVIDAIEATSHFFDVDPIAMKSAAFFSLGKSSKTPEDSAWVSIALLRLVDDFVAADLYEMADKTANAALQLARKSNEATLIARISIRAKEVGEAKTLYQGMKSNLETLAKTPDNPGANLEIGKFLCFVKNNWELGAQFLTKGSDVTLKTLSEKELTPLLLPADRLALADGWWDLAEKEKVPIKKTQMLAHAKMLYEIALPEAPALARVKIEKRLASFDAQKIVSTTNLLREYEAGKWKNLIAGRGDWVKGKEGYTFRPVGGGGPDFGWTYPLPKGTTSFSIKMVFKVRDSGATQIVFVEKTDVITGYGVALGYKWTNGFSVGNLASDRKTVDLPKLDNTWHTLNIRVMPNSISAKLEGVGEIQWTGKFDPTSITVSGDEYEDWQVSEFVLNAMR